MKEAAWIKCNKCDDFVCTLHLMLHVYDCPCPPIEDWVTSPYEWVPEIQLKRPLLLGVLGPVADGDECRTIAVWCPYCATRHTHTWDIVSAVPDSGSRNAEYRRAHCNSASHSPFCERGYWISSDDGLGQQARPAEV